MFIHAYTTSYTTTAKTGLNKAPTFDFYKETRKIK